MDGPRRIVSLVPSHTETLHDLGLRDRVVGRTRFCIHPKPWVDGIPHVGGTKDATAAKVLALAPDLVVADKDENPKPLVDELVAAGVEVIWSDIATVEEAAAFIERLGETCGVHEMAARWAERIRLRLAECSRANLDHGALPVFCPIWHPWMTFDGSAYPSAMLQGAGFRNVFQYHLGARYFEVDAKEVAAAGAQWTLLPTEPFPFHKHPVDTSSLGRAGRKERVRTIDGEALTWFGTRTLSGLEELSRVAAELRALEATLA